MGPADQQSQGPETHFHHWTALGTIRHNRPKYHILLSNAHRGTSGESLPSPSSVHNMPVGPYNEVSSPTNCQLYSQVPHQHQRNPLHQTSIRQMYRYLPMPIMTSWDPTHTFSYTLLNPESNNIRYSTCPTISIPHRTHTISHPSYLLMKVSATSFISTLGKVVAGYFWTLSHIGYRPTPTQWRNRVQ